MSLAIMIFVQHFATATCIFTRNYSSIYAAFISEQGIRHLIERLEVDIRSPNDGCVKKKDFQSSGSFSNLCIQPKHLPYPSWHLPLLSLPALCNTVSPVERHQSTELFSCWHLPQLMVYDFHVKTAQGRDVQNRSLLYMSTASERHFKQLRQILAETTAFVFLLSCNDEPLFPDWLLGHPQVLRVFAAHVPHALRHPKVIPIPLGIKKQWVTGIRLEQRLALSTRPTNFVFAKFSVKPPLLRVKRRSLAVQALQAKGWLRSKSENKRVTPGEFYRQLRQSKFIISPPGNGLDTFRTWETMALGRVAVVLSGQLHEDVLFAGLPVVRVPSWPDLNASLLTAAWVAASTAVFDANRLTRVWWLAYIVAHCLAVP
eukprot:EG_transcript_13774